MANVLVSVLVLVNVDVDVGDVLLDADPGADVTVALFSNRFIRDIFIDIILLDFFWLGHKSFSVIYILFVILSWREKRER